MSGTPYKEFRYDPVLGEGVLRFDQMYWMEIRNTGFPDNDDERQHTAEFVEYNQHIGEDDSLYEAEIAKFSIMDSIVSISFDPTHDMPGSIYLIDTAAKTYQHIETEPPIRESPCDYCRAFESGGCPPMCSELTKKEDTQ